MISLVDCYETLRNHSNMRRTIYGLNISGDEKSFLESSLNHTCSFEKAVAGKSYYLMGGGTEYTKDVLSLCGNYIFLVRVLDNVIDGHVNGLKLDDDLSKDLLYGVADLLTDKVDKADFSNAFPNIEGLDGSLELVQFFKQELNLYLDDNQDFVDEFILLSDIWCRDREYNSIYDYETGLELVGSHMQLSLVKLIEAFPDFSIDMSLKVRDLAILSGMIVQIRDDIVDGDKGVSKNELKGLLTKYENKLDDIFCADKRKDWIFMLKHLYPFLTALTDSEQYKNIRNYLVS
ncbi:MAG: hypothetical protein KAR23_06710 [Candidatus Aenigmarchaeota archaeon]|nr:hypothetical protein [Candidatus Aenigmarchaeota archaeon]